MSAESVRTCCFTGHRPSHFSFGEREYTEECMKLKQRLEAHIRHAVDMGFTHFISGMAQGADLWAAEIVLRLKMEYPHIRLECAVPCRDQAKRWSVREQLRYQNILRRCDKRVLISPVYTKSCMLQRDRYMVDASELVIAVYDGSPGGGTAYTVRYARANDRTVWVIDPKGE